MKKPTDEQLVSVRIEDIEDNPFRPKDEKYNEGKIEQLIAQIKSTGFWPIVEIRKHPSKSGKYQQVYGHHRKQALIRLGYEDENFILIEATDEEMLKKLVQDNPYTTKAPLAEQEVKLVKVAIDYLKKNDLGHNQVSVAEFLAIPNSRIKYLFNILEMTNQIAPIGSRSIVSITPELVSGKSVRDMKVAIETINGIAKTETGRKYISKPEVQKKLFRRIDKNNPSHLRYRGGDIGVKTAVERLVQEFQPPGEKTLPVMDFEQEKYHMKIMTAIADIPPVSRIPKKWDVNSFKFIKGQVLIIYRRIKPILDTIDPADLEMAIDKLKQFDEEPSQKLLKGGQK